MTHDRHRERSRERAPDPNPDTEPLGGLGEAPAPEDQAVVEGRGRDAVAGQGLGERGHGAHGAGAPQEPASVHHHRQGMRTLGVGGADVDQPRPS